MIVAGTGKSALRDSRGAKRMGRGNKAHTATANRIARRYGGTASVDGSPDIQTADLVVEVETSATVRKTVQRLQNSDRPTFVAVTNKEAILEALRYAQGTTVGVMDPHGDIIKQSQPPLEIDRTP